MAIRIGPDVVLPRGVTLDVHSEDVTLLSSFSTLYHVAKDGSDANPGTSALPFLTIAKATSVLVPGNAVFVHRGTYYESILPNSGTAGNQITYIGERGPNGEWLTVVEPTVAIGAVWAAAPEVGADVYKATLGYNPGVILYNNQCLGRLGDNMLTPDTSPGFTILAYPVNQTVTTTGLAKTINFWDMPYALFGYISATGVTYIRFKDGSNPNSLSLRASSITITGGWTFAVDAYQASYLTVRDLELRGAQASVRLSDAQHSIFENNNMMHGLHRFYMSSVPGSGALHDNIIRNNKMTLNWYGYQNTGAYDDGTSDGSASYDLGLKNYFYEFFKYTLGQNNTADVNIKVGYGGVNNQIINNEIHGGGEGVFTYTADGIEIAYNKFYDFSDDAIVCSTAQQPDYPTQTVNVSIHDNTFYNCDRGIRFDSIDVAEAGKSNTHYVYRNTFYNPSSLGTPLQFHFLYASGPPSSQASTLKLYVYHNNFGGCNASGIWSGYTYGRGGVPSAQFINNVFSNGNLFRWLGSGGNLASWLADATMFKAFAYNWCADNGVGQGGPGAWFHASNVVRQGAYLWGPGAEPTWVLPMVSDAREAGIDVSASYVIDAVTYPALPGFSAGYYDGTAPNTGAQVDPVTTNNLDRLSFKNINHFLRETDTGELESVGFAGIITGNITAAGAFYLPSGQRITSGAAAPVSGTWIVGDLVYNTAPVAGGVIGWVCIGAGTPGTWKSFGAIST